MKTLAKSLAKPTLLVLAAGMGNRYGGLKQIDPVGPGGETFIDYSVYDAMRAGFGRVVFVIRRDIEAAFKDAVGGRFETRVPVGYAFQETPAGRAKPWGTGHAILSAADAVREPFAVINGDDFYGASSLAAIGAHLSSSREYGMVAYVLRNTLSENGAVSRGVCDVGADGYLRGVVERTELTRETPGVTGDELVSMNLWGFQPSIFDHLRRQFEQFRAARGADPKAEFFIPSVVTALIEEGRERVKVLRTADPCFGVTYKDDRAAVTAAIRRLVDAGRYPERVWA